MATVSDLLGDTMALFSRTRRMTMELVSNIEPDDYAVQTAEYTSPPKWHVGHVSWIYEMVMRKIDASYSPTRFADDPYLNSYYNRAGPIHPKGARGAVSRPSAKELVTYFEEMSARVKEFVSNRSLDAESARLILTAIHHECQHQELLVYDLQHMLSSMYVPESRTEAPQPRPNIARKTVSIPGGLYEIGHAGKDYCYDIESPAHKEYLEDYEIDVFPVTCGQFAEFVGDGGYTDYRHWLSDGWDAVQDNSWTSPMYWERKDDRWHVCDFVGERPLVPDEPVCNISYYEADAYCRWAGRRLPTEAEWEVAACYDLVSGSRRAYPWGDAPPDETRANLLESRLWGRARVGSYGAGASPSGCEQMIGDVWEWTSSEFSPYPGFRSSFDEYNDKWFGNQKVLRGGSSATPRASIRTTYRNFFRPHERWMFSGFRCAS